MDGIAIPDLGLVRSVRLVGNHALPRAAFRLATQPGRPFSDSLLELDRQAILERYAEQGFYWAGVESPKTIGRDADVVFRVTEGAQARIGDIGFQGNRLIAGHKLRALLPFQAGSFTEPGIQANCAAILAFYADHGFPFCRVRPDSLSRSGIKVSYQLGIIEGPEVRLADVRFVPISSARLQTEPGLLRRMLGLRLNAPYSETEVRRRIARLAADPLLTVQGFDLRRTDERFWLEVRASETRANLASGALAYAAQDKELVGQVSLSLANLFGTRRAVHFNWQGSPGRQDLALSYTEPWLLGTGISLTGSARNRLRDTSFSATEFAVSASAGIAEALTLKLETGYDMAASGVSYLPSTRTAWAGSGLEWDTRDFRANPTQGLFAAIGTRVGTRNQESIPAQTVVRSNLDIIGILPFTSRFNITIGGHGRDVSATDTNYQYDLWELGGAGSLRGFHEGELTFARGAWLNTELRYLPGRDSRVYPFFDLALVGSPGSSYEWRSSYGAGVRVGTRIGLFGLDYGVRTGTSPLRGKVHFSIESSF